MSSNLETQNELIEFSKKLNTMIENAIKKKPDLNQKKIQELKKFIQSEGKSGLLIPYNTEFMYFLEILNELLDIPPNSFTYLIAKKIERNISEIVNFITLLRSTGNLLKEKEFMAKIIQEAQHIIRNYQKLAQKIFDNQQKAIEFYNKFILNKSTILGSDKSILYYTPLSYITGLSTPLQKIYSLNYHKDTQFILTKLKNRKKAKINAFFNNQLKKIADTIKAKEKNKQYFTIKEIIDLPEFSQILDLFLNFNGKGKDIKKSEVQIQIRNQEIYSSIFYIFHKKELISEIKKPFIDTVSKKRIKKQLYEFINKSYKHFFKNTININGENGNVEEIDTNKVFSNYIFETERKLEQETIEQDFNETQMKEFFSKKILPLYEVINSHNDWFLGLQEYLKPHGEVIRKYMKTLSQVRDELDRKYDDFIYYINSMLEQKTRSELDEIIDNKVKELENALKNYENETSKIILAEIPQAENISNILDDFQKIFLKINSDITQTFKEYKETKKLNIYSSMKIWEEKFDEIRNRVKFVVSALFSSFFEQFKDIVAKEQNFFSIVSNIPLKDQDIPFTFSLDMIMPERLSEKQLRERLNKIDLKLNEIDKLKEIYMGERTKYELIVEKLLEERGNIKSQQCVVCHKTVDIVNDHFINCEFCNRLSHYLCVAWWLEKHNSCPVCNNEYTIPDSGLFIVDDSEQEFIEPEDISTDYIDVDINKYPDTSPENKPSNDEKDSKK
ncbi:MAG: hypothetical protein GY870_16170 [archaeon]|nr:hypothetical protein [archaeon]